MIHSNQRQLTTPRNDKKKHPTTKQLGRNYHKELGGPGNSWLNIFHKSLTLHNIEMFHQHLRSQRRLSAYSANSAWSYEDHPIHANSHPTYPTFNTSRRPSACCSERSCELLSAEDTKDLWKCMLELQERYGCYNSARIDLAMGAGDEGINYMRKLHLYR